MAYLPGQPLRCARFRSDLGPVARWAARHRLDRVPMLLNVLRGEMALVGPRAERLASLAPALELVPDYGRKFSVLPGVTGLAQVAGFPDDVEGAVRRVHCDLFYIEHRSLMLDVRTLGRTIAVLARRPRRVAAPSATTTTGLAHEVAGIASLRAVRMSTETASPRQIHQRGEEKE
ncbi:MAG TPA: sugar transferase [Candidatus Eisenbacteria bacterium]|nr:sugar transferase [Candidatus Eisenbacteria bacterium]